MYDFHDFDDYRVAAWVKEGLMTPIARTAKSVVGTVVVAVALSASITAFASTTTFNMPCNVWMQTQPVVNQVDSEIAKLKQLNSEIQSQVAMFGEEENVQIAPETLELASRALAAIKLRPSTPPSDWALRLVSTKI